jgi:hypothetical protein
MVLRKLSCSGAGAQTVEERCEEMPGATGSLWGIGRARLRGG